MKMTTLIIASLCAATFAFGTAQAADQKFGADRHVGMGLSCETCHGPDKANPQEPTIDTCKQCHDVKDEGRQAGQPAHVPALPRRT